ncbi:MAG: ATP-binding protein [Gammaproteobacteria bacterium]|jgi:SpoVK/Ycf46/Vps4 family AAA+-type ATPase|nr:ATP-binding protein [Gammaproteobacteria bacterium]MBT4077731.1 ATP-binding protein [Gammaproteobacteria bacterium]MBT4195745.1 ATP-binding protein [Gammaproteobacteria bacterium]MBT4451258.1 ATP-binding protein [Gammaproteobacteria bacterium]MBT4861251.1 ATP-binding protein [Gammaproteobacteria bacterium]
MQRRFRLKKRKPSDFLGDISDLELIKLYSLRLLTKLGAHKPFIELDRTNEISFSDDKIANLIGIDLWLDEKLEKDDGINLTRKQVLKVIQKTHQVAEAMSEEVLPTKELQHNSQQLAQIIGLTKTECHILEFTVLLHTSSILEEATDLLNELSLNQLSRAISVLLDEPIMSVQHALSSKGKLQTTGLLTIDSRIHTMKSKMDLLSDKFAERMLSKETNPLDLFKDLILPTVPSTLKLKDFSHIGNFLRLLRPYLKVALSTERKGVNIFIYGAPGVGKTELVRLLAKDCGVTLYEVSCEDEDGDTLDTRSRLRAFQACQSILKKQKALLLFDEVEDIFGRSQVSFSNLFSLKNQNNNSKSWINRTLENNNVPTIWLSNDHRCMDPAFIRRFDLTFELPIPSRKQRERILRDQSEGILSESSITRMADSEQLAPAIVSRASSVIKSIRPLLTGEETNDSMEQLINNTLLAQGHKAILFNKTGELPDYYDPNIVNTDSNLTSIAKGIKSSGSGTFCLYGPSGTGKSAYVHWLAKYLELPLHVKKASDLLSKYVGEMEQNLAAAFRAAEQDKAILLLDEVDSFLQDRRGAKQTWEVTQVNELLTQMESYSGIFVATTNLVNNLDQAALRRFDLKLLFDYLKPDQAWKLYKHHCQSLGLKKPAAIQQHSITAMDILTPGDFALITRQHRFNPIKSHSKLIQCLEDECAMKEVGRKRAIGFT